MVVEIGQRYQLADPLGHGGMGTVWRAHDQVLKRDVALKEVKFPSYVPDEERRSLRERVLQEARAAARLSHPGAVTVYDVFEEDDKTFIAMELVEWPSLAQLVEQRGPLPPEMVARIGAGLLQTLSEAHSKGIIHRDVKPGNVMVSPDAKVKLTDFGIASVKGGPDLTATGVILGSPSYMSPEQARGEAAGPASDLWALGATMYFAAAGKAPFEKGDPLPTLNAILTDDPPFIEGPLGTIITELLSKDAAARPGPEDLKPRLESLADAPALTPGAQTLRMEDERPAAAEETLPADDGEVPGTEGMTPPQGQSRRMDSEGAQDKRRLTAAATPASQSEVPASGKPRTGRWLAPLAALLVVAGVLFALTRLPTAERQEAEPSRTEFSPAERQPDPQPSAQPQRAEQPEGDQVSVPGNWRTFSLGATGYEIRHPPSWRIVSDPLRDGNSVRFADRSGKYLLVDWTDQPGEDAVAAWRDQAQSFSQRHQNYSEIRIEPTRFRNFDTAAIWEFTYSEGGTTLHAIDLGFADDRWGFALNFQTREDQWEESQDTFEQFKASFRPA